MFNCDGAHAMSRFPIHSKAIKLGGAMNLNLTVLGSITKLSGRELIVVEDELGRVLIYKPELLVPIEEKKS